MKFIREILAYNTTFVLSIMSSVRDMVSLKCVVEITVDFIYL